MDMFQGVLSPRGKVPLKVKKMNGIHMLALSECTITVYLPISTKIQSIVRCMFVLLYMQDHQEESDSSRFSPSPSPAPRVHVIIPITIATEWLHS